MTVKVAVARHPQAPGNAHFGYADRFEILDASLDPPVLLEVRENLPHCGEDGGDHALLDDVVDLLSDCVAVVVAKVGPCGREALLSRRIVVVEHDGPGLDGADAELATVRTYVNDNLIAEGQR
jgi:nitrogen fixation protein NifB